MPTYEYACSKCGHTFETFQPMKDAPLKKCPQCGKPALRRLVGTGAGLIFKGSGFYITDYKNKSGAPKEGGGGGEIKPAAPKVAETKSTGGGGDSKPSGAAAKKSTP
jgi:putative FmdB family regulatory protein